MHASTSLLALLLTTSLSAAAVLKPRVLTADQVIVYGNDGRTEVISKAEYIAALQLGPRPEATNTTTITDITDLTEGEDDTNTLTKRCKSHTIIYENPTQKFQNWDVVMSGVVRSPPASAALVAVSSGYSISNTLGVSASSEMSLIKDFLSVSYEINYSQTWGTTYAAAYTFEVPAGKIGAVVSNPTTTRRSGKVWRGCPGTQGRTVEYSGDSYESRAYGGLTWVDGVIGLCFADEFPLKRCLGEGFL